MQRGLVGFLMVVVLVVGCKEKDNAAPAATASQKPSSDRGPQGGTPVMIGHHGFHLELIPVNGSMQAYVYDAHMERMVPVKEAGFEILVQVEGQVRPLEFHRKSDGLGTADSSPLFVAQAEWLARATNFPAMIPQITLRGATFTNIVFNYPRGTKHMPH